MIEEQPEAGTLQVPPLVLEIRRDGVPFSETAMLRAVDHPQWEAAFSAHDWRAYVPPAVREQWASLSLCARLCLFETAELIALNEAVGAVMITDPTGYGRNC